MSRNFYNLFMEHHEHIAKTRGIKTSGMVDLNEQNKIESRATFLTLLDAVLYEHRKKYATPFNNLSGRSGLEHLVLLKHHWSPKEIRELAFEDLLLAVQDELNYKNASEDAKNFLEHRDWSSMIHHFADINEDEWNPSFGPRFLTWRPQPEN